VQLTAADIIEATGGRLAAGSLGAAIAGLSTDSRAIKAGEVFIALVGERFNGHAFLRQVAEAKASAVIISDGAAAAQLLDYQGAVIIVADTQRALGDLAAWHRRKLRCRVVAITGSCGKTSVKEMLGQILSTQFRGRRPESSFNNFIGVPLTILRSQPGDDYLLVELGTNAPGEMRHLAAIASPDMAVVTCVGPSHLEGLGSIEGVAHEKEELVRALTPAGVAVLNCDDERVRTMAEATKARVVTFGLSDGDVRAENVVTEPRAVTFRLNSGADVRVPVPGRHNVMNALAAIAVAREMGMADPAIVAALARYRPPKMRLVREVLPGGVTLIDDAYNANLMSSVAALEVLCDQPTTGRRVLVQGDMLELGSHAAELHKELGRSIGQSCVNLLVTVGTETKATSLVAAERKNLVRLHFPDSQTAAGEVVELLAPGDVVLVKGSRGMAMEYVVSAIRDKFAAAGGG
jgi:UDP-N-acetylmuramoyl-tripeptide--D-alanyl-D-alanine ligase